MKKKNFEKRIDGIHHPDFRGKQRKSTAQFGGMGERELQARMELLVDEVLSSQKRLLEPAKTLAKHSLTDQERFLAAIELVCDRDVELAFNFCHFCSTSLILLNEDQWGSWIQHLLKTYDTQGLNKAIEEMQNVKKYLDSGNYLWNSGIFLFRASVYLRELEKFEPEIYTACKKSSKSVNIDSDFVRLDNIHFRKCPSKSIDYAVMEKTKNAVVVPFNGVWSDIGSWDTLWKAKPKDTNNNVIEGDVILDKVSNSYVYSSNRLVSATNLSDLIIIDTQDALLVSSKKSSQNINNIVEKLKIDSRSEKDDNRKVYRPWGYFDSIDYGEGFQVKRLFINPGAKLSLQKHQKRAEHWVVVKGIALVTCGEKKYKLTENQSTYIPKGEIHRLENREKNPLEIIEIQTGNYLGEDDIIRLEDDYERN